MTSVHAVLFDYGLVLSGPPHPEAWDAMKLVFGADEPQFHPAYWRHRHDYDRGALGGTTYWSAVANDLGHGLSAAQVTTLLAEDVNLWTRPNGPMIDWAARLQRAGTRTGILSNIGDAMEDGIRAKAKWLDGFAHHTFSHRLGIAKPELAIYTHAVQGLGVPAEHVLFIDDREENITAALEAGLQAIQYSAHGQFVGEMYSRGLRDLLDV